MDMQADIKWIKAELETLTDPSLIDMLKRLIQYGKSQKKAVDDKSIDELYKDAERANIEQYNKEIEESEGQIKEGNFYTQAQVERKFAR